MIDCLLSEFHSLNSSTLKGDVEEAACKLFWKFVESGHLQDDLLFFVSQDGETQVCRYDLKHRPSLEINVKWSETLALNLICHLKFRLRVTVCAYFEGTVPGMSHLVVEESFIRNIFATPFADAADKSNSTDSVASQKKSSFSFPDIYFTVQEGDSVACNVDLKAENILIIELFYDINGDDNNSTGKFDNILRGSFYERLSKKKNPIFQGAISSDSLLSACRSNTIRFGNQKGSLVTMSGPDSIGDAQIQVFDTFELTDHIEELVSSQLKKLKGYIFGKPVKIKSGTPSNFACRLQFIKMHWKHIMERLKLEK